MKFYNRLSFRITVAVLTPTIIILGFIIYTSYQNSIKLAEKQYANILNNINREYVDYINTKLYKASKTLKYDAKKCSKADFTAESLLKMSKEIVESDELFFGSAIAFKKGVFKGADAAFFYSYKKGDEIAQISFTDQSDEYYFDYQNLKQDWWYLPSTTYREGWTKPYYDFGASKTDMVTYFQPFFINDCYAGTITIDITLEQIQNILQKKEEAFTNGINPDVIIFNQNKELIYTNKTGFSLPRNNNIFDYAKLSKYNTEEISEIIIQALNNTSSRALVNSKNGDEKYFILYDLIHSASANIITTIPYSDIKKSIIKKVMTNIAFSVFYVIIISIIIIIIVRFITIPIRKLSKYSLLISKGNYDLPIHVKSPSEIGILASNFGIMKERLKKREKEILLANAKLKELDHAKNKFLSLISHEIRTPLNGIIGFSSILKESIQEPELAEYMNMLIESVNRLDDFSRKALEITQMQTIGNNLQKEPIHVNKILTELIDTFSIHAEKEGIGFTSSLSEFDEITSNENYLTGSISELLNNAVKFSHKGTEISVRTFIVKDLYIIEIANTGEVIPQEKINIITKAFGLAKEHYDRNIGLGLSYVQTFCDISNIELKISSSVKRTIFTLTFKKP